MQDPDDKREEATDMSDEALDHAVGGNWGSGNAGNAGNDGNTGNAGNAGNAGNTGNSGNAGNAGNAGNTSIPVNIGRLTDTPVTNVTDVKRRRV